MQCSCYIKRVSVRAKVLAVSLFFAWLVKMVEPLEMQNDTVDKASKWTIYFLIDLRVVFIIIYVYVTIVNLISTTADNEATSDKYVNITFNVTS